MDPSGNSRPLLQQSSDEEASDFDYIQHPGRDEPKRTSVDQAAGHPSSSGCSGSSRNPSNASLATREMGADQSVDAIPSSVDEDDDDEDDEEADDSSHQVSVNMAKELLRSENAPKDRFNFSYVVFYLLGMTTLLPWNFFITADDYWMYKFRDLNHNGTALTPIQASFTSDLSVASAIPNTLFLILNAFIGHRIPLQLRMIGSLVLVLIFFMVTTALVEVNTDPWQHDFFRFTLATVVIMNVGAAILGGGIFGISGQFPSEYITAVVSGQALGGIFAAIAQIISLTFGASPTATGFVYFLIGNAVMVIALICYIVMSRTKFFKFYTVQKLALIKASLNYPEATLEPNFYVVLRKVWLYGAAEWLVFVVTLCVYPAVTVLVTSQNHGNGHPWNDVYFLPVVNYLIFNSGDYLGRILAGMIEWPRNSPFLVFVMAVLRIGFVPALIVCNASPRHYFPTLFHADYIFITLMGFFSFTNGYLANIALIWAPKSVHSREKEMASSMMAAFLGIGLAFGSALSLVLVEII